MKRKTKIVSCILLIIMLMGILIPTVVNAAFTNNIEPVWYGIRVLRTKDTPNLGYAIGDPGTNGTSGPAAVIWNIVRFTDKDSQDPTEEDVYCIKAGVGFTNLGDKAQYDLAYDMKNQKDEMIKRNLDIFTDEQIGIMKKKIIKDGQTYDGYNSLLALGDLILLTEKATPEQRTALLEKAGIYIEEGQEVITYDAIDAIQQAAIWYFTNYGEENNKYDKTDDFAWLNYTDKEQVANNPFNALQDRHMYSEQVEPLYNYFVNTALANSKQYENASAVGAPAVVETKSLNYEAVDNNYVVGPIKISKVSGNSNPFTIDFNVSNQGTSISDYRLLDSKKNDVTGTKTIEEIVKNSDGQFYISLPKEKAVDLKVDIKVNYRETKLTCLISSTNNAEQPLMIPEIKEESVPTTLELKPIEKIFDLSLRKYITKINGVDVKDTRVPNIDESALTNGTTASYKHRKDPLIVKTGDKVIYKLTIYNEGEKSGRATKLVDQLPTGLKFSKVVSGNFELDSYSETDNRLKLKRVAGNEDNLAPYTPGNLQSETVEIECEVTAKPDTTNAKILTNVAWISEEYDADSKVIITDQKNADRDSEPSTTPDVNKDNMSNYNGNGNKEELTDSDFYYKGQQDDDDFEKLIMIPESFDLKLIKRITQVNNQNVPERIESVDVSKLNTIVDGKLVTTADYKLNKTPVGVKKGDIVTYTFRIYNEGTIDGYAQEITEDIPEGLEFIWSEKTDAELDADEKLTQEEKEAIRFNQKYLWKLVPDAESGKVTTITTDYLSKEVDSENNLIHAFGKNDGNKTEKDLDYKEVSVKLKVVAENISGNVIRNEAAITDDCDPNGDPVEDRDSKPEEWKKYEDDEDYDNIILQSFDLALRKFIIAVSKDNTIENNEYLKNEDGSYIRQPQVDTSKLNTKDENGKVITTAIYNHTKEPVLVRFNDTVVYMLRVYNEGDIDGYAAEIKDHLPPYLSFVEGEFNEKYGWKVSEDGRCVTTDYLKDELIKKAVKDENGKYVLSYKEVPIMCKVSDKAKTSENITNIADITDYKDEDKKDVEDRDSQENNVDVPKDEDLPGYKDEDKNSYVPGQQDDDDFEKVIVKKFDLALRKWVTQAIVIDKNGTTITETGHQPYDDPEQVVKVELHRRKINEVTVKFRYSIRVINEGEIAGYAKEVTDYVPEGLKFVAEDNPGWVDEGNNVISTRALENTLLQPGEYADVEVVLTWINNENNFGVKVNTAEISEDDNEYDVPDIDSTPDNKVPGEDDIDDAPVMLSISTGRMKLYTTLGLTILVTLAGGIVLIKKYVL